MRPLTWISTLADQRARVTATSMRSLILFPFHPFTNIWSAIFKPHAIRFTTHKKAHYLAIDYANFFQIYDDVVVVRLEFEESPQFSYRRFFDSAT